MAAFSMCSADEVRLLQTPHPRLLLQSDQLPSVKKAIEDDSIVAAVNKRILQGANGMLSSPLLKYEKTGRRLLNISQQALRRIFTLSYAYRLTDKEEYAARAVEEMKNVCQFQDWNPSHFLDVAEMTLGVAIGYDWLYERIDSADRKLISKAIVDKAFDPAVNGKPNFYNGTNNLNSVCNAGLLYGAIAVWDEYPDIANVILKKCLDSNPKALGAYAPDGVYPEGYGYWDYGTTFQVLLIDALMMNFGEDFGLSQYSGFLESAKFREYMASPVGKCFNFSDCSVSACPEVTMWWFAEKLNDPSVLFVDEILYDGNVSKFAPYRLLPLLPVFASRVNLKKIKQPESQFFHGDGKTPVMIYRGGWNDKNDSYLGVKGGSASTSHAHMDAGSFVYDFDGIRWAEDLGSEDYYSIESKGVNLWDSSQEGQRWNVLRLRNEYHNTLTINGKRHNVKPNAKIIGTFENNDKKGAVIDLTETLGDLDSAVRQVYLDDTDHLHVTDSIRTSQNPIELMSVIVTSAEPLIVNDNSIVLTKEDKQMIYEVDANVPISLFVLDNNPIHDYDAPNPGTCRIGFKAAVGPNEGAVFSYTLSPYTETNQSKSN